MCSIWYINLFLFACSLRLVNTQSPYYSCPSSALSYNSTSIFEQNLNALLASLAARASISHGFYNTTVGQSPDQVHGLVQCHRDVSADDCRSCAASASSQIVQACPGKRMAVIWFDDCLLRYNSFNFFGVVDASEMALVNTVSMSNPTSFKPIVQFLFNNLIKSATTNISAHMYVTDSVKYTNNITIYCLAECTRDLSLEFCSSCLKGSVRAMSQCCSDRQGARILSGSCVIRYEIYPFFGNLSTATAMLLPPPPSSTSDGAPTNSSGVVTGECPCLQSFLQ